MTKDHIIIHPIPVLKDNYVWTLVDRERNVAVVVDPGAATPVIDYLESQQLKLVGILITHKHWDHTNGVQELVTRYQCPVYASALEHIPYVTHPINGDHETIEIPGFPLRFHVIAIPGHTIGHVAYHTNDIVFTGDALFACGCGRIFEGTPAEMFHSLQKLAALPDNTKIYCGHEYTLNNLRFAHAVQPDNQDIDLRLEKVRGLIAKGLPSLPSTLQEEKQTNPFLRCDIPAVIAKSEQYSGLKLPCAVDVFAALRRWKDEFV